MEPGGSMPHSQGFSNNPYHELNQPNYEVPYCETTPHSHPFWAQIFASGPFSNTLSLYSSFNVRDHVSQPYSRTGNFIVLYILIFKFLERSLEDKSV